MINILLWINQCFKSSQVKQNFIDPKWKLQIWVLKTRQILIWQTTTFQAEHTPFMIGNVMPNCLRNEARKIPASRGRGEMHERRSWGGWLASSTTWWSFLINRSVYTDPKSCRDTPIIFPASFTIRSTRSRSPFHSLPNILSNIATHFHIYIKEIQSSETIHPGVQSFDQRINIHVPAKFVINYNAKEPQQCI